ncbi:MAG: tetratricopeptide repeat protein, partial [Gemmatimonadota bacterium]|nr:tetratricopeptide repeat protein [Gemmatimonadota bacterium]
SADGLLAAALQTALAADAPGAERHLSTLRALSSEALLLAGSAPEVVEAVIAKSNGDWDTVIESLTPMEAWTWPHYFAGGSGWFLGGVVLSLLGEAHESLGQYEAAATYYEKLASPVEVVRRYDLVGGGLATSFARQRLVVLYAALGRVEDAERHFRVFSDTFTNPDPDLVHLVDEAREALASARDNTKEPTR